MLEIYQWLRYIFPIITQIGLDGEEFIDMHEYDDRMIDAEVEHRYGV